MANLNSLEGFLRSIRRAANSAGLQPALRTVVLRDGEHVTEEHRHREHEDRPPTDGGVEEERDNTQLSSQPRKLHHSEPPPDDVSPLVQQDQPGHQHGGFEPLHTKLHEVSRNRVMQLSQRRKESRAQQKDEEREPLLTKQIRREDGTEGEVIVGQSTLPQTIFNSSNVLIGVGMLSLPLGIRCAGWIIGLGSLIASALVTKYTASLLAKFLDADSSLANFADIAYIAFGEKGRLATSILFTLELTAACVGLVVLFADSLKSLMEGPSDAHWKILCGCILLPLNFVPMRLLSFTSFLGIFCGFALVVCVFVAGFLKSSSPGSLLEVATTYAFPESWKALPLSFGLIMAVWGGHGVFPNIYRDMRHPHKYESGLRLIFSFVALVDVTMAVIGYLLYGNLTKDEITTNILTTDGYPQALSVLLLVLVAIVPLTKFPLKCDDGCSPIISTLEVHFRVEPRAATVKPNKLNQSAVLSRLLEAVFRIGVNVIIVVLALVVPSFEVISAIMGATFCFLICVILPVLFHLKMFRGQIPRSQLIFDWTVIVVCTILAVAGTVWEILPKSWMGLRAAG
ncbi:hypothetical protein BAUCODRAFT_63649 [Baudoinia panamericana UAMH 10762]|uniref:Amino acid transporter transmembrane domain-containing protein n=1 Tax=Baudoinia panamericana (strain UAMH 10762) TaxID=717646 RepID=M2NM94_BAUPA|nr:uncharacterized protein BAUCODRAFT_63649 [Baudoinia panamericana UAMH 10762]EMD00301.1 hypothetical protein BAUCODRAFT_63649 [Baudoinia panamericana UAMH 10762]